MINSTLKNNAESKQWVERFSYSIKDNSEELKSSIDKSVINITFSYITSIDGLVLADSRLTEEKRITDFVGKKLPEDEYKNTSF